MIASCGAEKLVVQCKDWSAAVGFDAVKEVHAARAIHAATHAAVIASGGFTSAAQQGAAKLDIHLLTLDRLVTGGHLDRSLQGERLRRRRMQEQAEGEETRRRAAMRALRDEWLAYDINLQNYPAQRQRDAIRLAGIVGASACGAWALIALLRPNALGVALLVAVAIAVAAGAAESFLKRKPPAAPRQARPASETCGAASDRLPVPCKHCRALLNLPTGRAGRVQCPACKKSDYYVT